MKFLAVFVAVLLVVMAYASGEGEFWDILPVLRTIPQSLIQYFQRAFAIYHTHVLREELSVWHWFPDFPSIILLANVKKSVMVDAEKQPTISKR